MVEMAAHNSLISSERELEQINLKKAKRKMKKKREFWFCGYSHPLEFLRIKKKYGVLLNIYTKFTSCHLIHQKPVKIAEALKIEMWNVRGKAVEVSKHKEALRSGL